MSLGRAGLKRLGGKLELSYVLEETRRFHLLVPAEDADEARAALTEPLPELPDYDTKAPTRDEQSVH